MAEIIDLNKFKINKLQTRRTELIEEIEKVAEERKNLIHESCIGQFITQVLDKIKTNISPNPEMAKIEIQILLSVIQYNYCHPNPKD